MLRSAKFLVRLDDACPTMRKSNWLALEKILDKYSVKPIIGVIPDNRDKSMYFESADPFFWDQIRSWSQKGWEISMHGLYHNLHMHKKEDSFIIRSAVFSEFSGLPLNTQKEMIIKGVEILERQGIKPRSFMPPAHGFDKHTLDALLEASSIKIVTDGHSLRPFKAYGLTWVPQQLWKFYNIPFGIWCICLHPNSMTLDDIRLFEKNLSANSKKFITIDEAIAVTATYNAFDLLFEAIFYRIILVKKIFL